MDGENVKEYTSTEDEVKMKGHAVPYPVQVHDDGTITGTVIIVGGCP